MDIHRIGRSIRMEKNIAKAQEHIDRIEMELSGLKALLEEMKQGASKAEEPLTKWQWRTDSRIILVASGDMIQIPSSIDRKKGECDLQTLSHYCDMAVQSYCQEISQKKDDLQFNIHVQKDNLTLNHLKITACLLIPETLHSNYRELFVEVRVDEEDYLWIEIYYVTKNGDSRKLIYSAQGIYEVVTAESERRDIEYIFASQIHTPKVPKEQLEEWREKGYRPVYSQNYSFYTLLKGASLATDTSRTRGQLDINTLQKILQRAWMKLGVYLNQYVPSNGVFEVDVSFPIHSAEYGYSSQFINKKQKTGVGLLKLNICVQDEGVNNEKIYIDYYWKDNSSKEQITFMHEIGLYGLL